MSSVGPRRIAALVALLLCCSLLGCSGSGNGNTAPSRTPAPSYTAGKPGGTLRVVGSARSVPLDPAEARDDGALLVDRLIYRQLYSYRPGNPEPVPDLAKAEPSLSSDRLTATITLRDARWNTALGRNVTSGDVLRALKRLCSPTVLAPERGYLDQVVVGYAEFCAKASAVRLGRAKQPDLDAVSVPGLRAVGDTEVQILLRRPAADLQQILALPALSPLPFEIKDGFGDPLQLISDGPYRFIQPENGEVYRLSRNASWDPGADEARDALVDRITFRGGLDAGEVQQRLASNNADLSWDVEAPVAAPARSTVRVDDRGLALLAVGAKGPAARQLGALAARSALAACVDRPALRAAFGGPTVTTPTDALLTPQYLNAPDVSAAAPTPSGSSSSGTSGRAPASATGASATPTTAGGSARPSSVSSTPMVSPTSSPSVSSAPTGSPPSTVGQCRTGLTRAGLKPGSDFVVLSADTDQERAAATSVQKRLSDAGLAVQLRLVPASRLAAVSALGGWDLALLVEQPEYAGARAVLSPLLAPSWPGDAGIGAVRRSATWYAELWSALAQDSAASVAQSELALSRTLALDGSFVAVSRLATVRTTGPNVGPIPPLALLGNADPTNVALGVTRPGESPAPAPATS